MSDHRRWRLNPLSKRKFVARNVNIMKQKSIEFRADSVLLGDTPLLIYDLFNQRAIQRPHGRSFNTIDRFSRTQKANAALAFDP